MHRMLDFGLAGLAAGILSSTESFFVSNAYGQDLRDTKIAFVRTDLFGNDDIYIMNPDGSEQTNLTKSPGRDYAPSWSPDGRNIAFVSRRNGNNQIYVMNPDGSNQTNLTK